MKLKYIFLTAFAALAMSCSNVEKKAEAIFSEAETAYAAGRYDKAKMLVDSIKTTYPKAFETRKKSIGLMQKIEIGEQEKTLAYLDSMRTEYTGKLNAIKGNYMFLKNEEYQDFGTYICPRQDLNKLNDRSLLYASVDETGKMKLTSIYFGQRSVEHHSIKVESTKDNSFIQTRHSENHYSSTHFGFVTEKTEYEVGTLDNGLAEFIIYNKDVKMYVNYIGIRPYKRQLTKPEIESVIEIYDLYKILKTLDEIRKQETEANNKLNFFRKKLESGNAASETAEKEAK